MGLLLGEAEGLPEGDNDGLAEGDAEGNSVGLLLGEADGVCVVLFSTNPCVKWLVGPAPSASVRRRKTSISSQRQSRLHCFGEQASHLFPPRNGHAWWRNAPSKGEYLKMRYSKECTHTIAASMFVA